MSRNITDDAIIAIESAVYAPVYLVQITFSNETIYVNSASMTINWNGHNWLGVGVLGNISTIAESSDTQANGIILTLSGIPTEYLTDALSFANGNGTAQVLLACMLANGSLVADPFPLYFGFTDAPTIDCSTETISLSIAVENRLSDMQRSQQLRYTDSTQRSRYPADASFQFVQYVADLFINWSKAKGL
jgi:hypothetical protein